MLLDQSITYYHVQPEMVQKRSTQLTVTKWARLHPSSMMTHEPTQGLQTPSVAIPQIQCCLPQMSPSNLPLNICYNTSHFSNNIVRSSLLSFSLTSHIETAPSSLRKQSVKAVPTPLPSHNVRAPELQTPQIAPLCTCAQQELPKELCLVCLSAFNN